MQISQKMAGIGIGIGVLGVVCLVGTVIILTQYPGREQYGGMGGGLSSGEPVSRNLMMESVAPESNFGMGMDSVAKKGMSVSESPVEIATNMTSDSSEQRVIRDASVSIRVKSADEAVAKLHGVADWYKGFVSSVNVWDDGKGMKSGSVTISVPTESFDAAIVGIKDLATVVVQETVSNQDVTAEFVDREARLKNKRAEEQAFAKILETAGKMSDVIDVTRELARVRGEIEVMEGQLRYMDSRTVMATITAQISEDQEVSFTETWRPWQEIRDRASDLLTSLQGFVSGLIVLAVWFLPLAILYGLLIFMVGILGRSVYRKIRKGDDGEV